MREQGPIRRGAHGHRVVGRGERGRGGWPRGTTRERILDIALDLFTERGYDKTSLREIADELGFTKAALYYHFERKEDILMALHMRIHALGHEVLDRLGQLGPDEQNVEVWSGLLDEFIDQVVANRKLFTFQARNHNALEQIYHNEHNTADHEDMEQRLRAVLSDATIPTATRVRMACAIGAVFGGLLEAGEVFADVPIDELASLVRDAVRDLLGAKRPATNGRRPPRTLRF